MQRLLSIYIREEFFPSGVVVAFFMTSVAVLVLPGFNDAHVRFLSGGAQ